MPNNGSIKYPNLAVKRVAYGPQASTLVVSDGTVTITVETSGTFPQDLKCRPGDLVDVKVNYDDGSR